MTVAKSYEKTRAEYAMARDRAKELRDNVKKAERVIIDREVQKLRAVFADFEIFELDTKNAPFQLIVKERDNK